MKYLIFLAFFGGIDRRRRFPQWEPVPFSFQVDYLKIGGTTL